jgi:hypothetical protein
MVCSPERTPACREPNETQSQSRGPIGSLAKELVDRAESTHGDNVETTHFCFVD